MFRIKICGVRRPADVHASADAGADAVGLNFFPASKRYVCPDDAATALLAQTAARRGLLRVGVVVNMPVPQIARLAATMPLDAVQLHGDELPGDAETLLREGVAVIRAVRLPGGPLNPQMIEAAVQPWRSIGCAVLLDADAGAAYGGRGQRLDWKSLAAWSDTLSAGKPWILAGGLTPLSVAQAIQQAHPSGVDVASGVERLRGNKCPQSIFAFCTAAASLRG